MTKSASPLKDEWKNNPGFVIAYCPFLEAQGSSRIDSLVVSFVLSDEGVRTISHEGYSKIASLEKDMPPSDPVNARILQRHAAILGAFDKARAEVSGNPDAVQTLPVYEAETYALTEPVQQ